MRSTPTTILRVPWRWALGALALGLVLGGTSVWWMMRVRLESEAQQIARRMLEEAAGPRVPGPPGPRGGNAGSVAERVAGGRSGGVPVIAVTDDLEQAFRDLLAIQDPAVRQAALKEFLDELPVNRWPGFLMAVKKLGERQEFQDNPGTFMAALGTMESVFSLMMQRAPEQLLSGVLETRTGQEMNDDSERDDDMAMIAFRFWAGQDLPAAMAYFEKNLSSLPPGKQADAASGLAREFVKTDPAGTFAWIKRLPKENQAQVAQGAFQTLSHIDSPAALRFLVTEKELPNRDDVAESMAKGWAATEPENALAWAKQLPEDLTARAVKGAMEHLAQQDFAAAVRETGSLAPAQQDAALKALVEHMGDKPERVPQIIQLVENAAEGPGRVDAARTAALKWTTEDPAAASAWVAAQPDGPTRDAAIQGFGRAAVTSKQDPEAGLEWTAAIGNSEQRGNWLRENVKAWANYDPAAARAWVEVSQRLNYVDREVLLPLTRK